MALPFFSLSSMLESRRHYYRRPAGFHYAAGVSLGSSVDKACISTTHITSDSLGNILMRNESEMKKQCVEISNELLHNH